MLTKTTRQRCVPHPKDTRVTARAPFSSVYVWHQPWRNDKYYRGNEEHVRNNGGVLRYMLQAARNKHLDCWVIRPTVR